MTEREIGGSFFACTLWRSQNIFPRAKLNIKKLFSSYLHPVAEPKIFLGVNLNIKKLFRSYLKPK